MKNILRSSTFLGILIIASIITFSCSKEDGIDNKDMFVYTSSGNSTYNISTGELLKTIETSELTSGLSFGLTITRPANTEISVKAEIDTSLLNAYDKLKSTVSIRYDLTKFQLNKDQISIAAGSLNSSENFSIILKDLSLEITNPCVIPIRITALGDVNTSKIRDVMYLVISGQKKITSSFSTILDRINSNYSLSNDVYPQYGFPVNLNISLPASLKVAVEYDQSLVDQYNEKNKTSFIKAPQGSFILKNSEVNIQDGKLQSQDSIKIEFPDRSKFELGKEYLIPIKITNGGKSFISESNGVKYIVFKPDVTNVNPSNPSISSPNVDRSGWTAVASETYTASYSASNVLDGNNSTSWFSILTRQPFVTIDMKSTKVINGFTIVPNYGAFGITYNFLSMEVYSSDDGVNFNLQGTYRGNATLSTSNANNPDFKNVKFYVPVSAQYFRFKVMTSSNTYTGIGEIYAK